MARRSKGMDDEKLLALVDHQITDAVSFDGSERKERRKLALQYANGEMPDVEAPTGKSQVVSQDLSDAIGWILASLMRVFLASDRLGEYEPETQEDEQFAAQATDYVNHVFLKECDGYRILRFALDDALKLGNGILKHWWDATPEERVEDFTGLSEAAFISLVQEEGVEVLEHSEYPDPAAGQGPGGPAALLAGPAADAPPQPGIGGPGAGNAQDGAPVQPGMVGGMLSGGGPLEGGFGQPPLLHDLKIKRVVSKGRLMVEVVPDEDFLIERNARALTEKECRFCAHKARPTRSELIERGYDREKVEALPIETETEEANERRGRNGGLRTETFDDEAAQRVTVYECYIRADVNGDGITELVQLVVGGLGGERQLLDIQEWGDDLPFTDLVVDPVAHDWRGRSLYDELRDIQRVKTVLTRKMLDNLYMTVEPNRAIDLQRVKNPDAVTDLKAGDIIVTDGPPGDIILDLAVPFVAREAFPMMEYMDNMAERRIGVGASSQGLDQDALQNQTATAVQATQSAQATKKEDYARNVAEIGLKRFFQCMLRLIVKHQDWSRSIKLRDKWVEMDPRAWNANMRVSINTGLGSGSRDRDMQMLAAISQKQMLYVQALGPVNPVLGIDRAMETDRKMVETAGLKSPEKYFPEVPPEVLQQMAQQQAQKPDPKMMEVQAKVQASQAQMQAELQMKQAQAQVDQQSKREEMQAKLEQAVQQMQLDHAMNTERMNREFALKEQEMKANAALKVQELQLEAQLKREQMVYTANQQSAANIQEAGPL